MSYGILGIIEDAFEISKYGKCVGGNIEILSDNLIEHLKEELFEICNNVHDSCSSACPVFEINDSIPWNEKLTECECFKSGDKMFDFILKFTKDEEI